MATANFYLKDSTSKKETPIYISFFYNGQRLKFYTGETILPKNWNNQKVRKSVTNSPELNRKLKSIKDEVEKFQLDFESKREILSIDELKKKLKENLRTENKSERIKDFYDYLNEFMEVKKGLLRVSTLKKFRTLYNHLKHFQQLRRYKISFETIDAGFDEKFRSYLINDLRLLNNSIAKYFTVLKTFLFWATERGYNSKIDFRKFKSKKEETDIIALTENELTKIYEFDFSNNNRLERVRDTFIFGCVTGMRFSDISNLKKENVRENFINYTQIKTNEKVSVALNDYSREILHKYDFKLPAISNQKSNDYLKEIGKIVGIDEPYLKTQRRGAEIVETKEPKYNFLSTHTARKTFATLSLEGEMRAETVMANGGWKDYKTFKRYVDITPKMKIVEMNKAWSKKSKLKVVG